MPTELRSGRVVFCECPGDLVGIGSRLSRPGWLWIFGRRSGRD